MNNKRCRLRLEVGLLRLGVGLLLWSLGSPAFASPPVHLFETAPFARKVVKAQWKHERAGWLVFSVERVFAGPPVDEIEVRAGHWREAWGRPGEGYTGFFVYSDNPSVDIVFEVAGDQARVFFRGTVLYMDPPPERLPLEEVEARLALVARDRAKLSVSLHVEPRAEPEASASVVFRNAADHPIFVNLDANYRFDVRDLETGKLLRQIPQIPDPWDCEAEIRQLLPGEEVARQVPAAVLTDLEPARLQLHLQYRSEGGCRRSAEKAPPEEPPVWAGRKDAHIELDTSPTPE